MVRTSASAQASAPFSEETLLAAATKKYPDIKWENMAQCCGDTIVISALMPLQSAAGWYLGWLDVGIEDGKATYLEPYDRQSICYYPDKETLIRVEGAGG